ncbi:hypothetical protein F441_16069 [Phytophthora nicotianae CJ01A1]|uniref:Uncharacterized protein n=4 Tax=Phytophthora nicotianae TaxID=4792 RepID=W2YLX0_PHYNI|nr:hypothetical protein L915_15794 [Phytophthora nicotianae]ETL31531.1 hypothetical protein L916_15690 [Phytophthora nicotianae]ETO66654.1 hypothetical protein F444_16237 [Phytophthora nicotianae P1976]ETP07781.1 hypothetical protein F441_16069 [Phytophthora nicotianae CJ01A1]ETP35812.1 hypothetical protein F442_16097 [Phytophthora nicotianae P10297]
MTTATQPSKTNKTSIAATRAASSAFNTCDTASKCLVAVVTSFVVLNIAGVRGR